MINMLLDICIINNALVFGKQRMPLCLHNGAADLPQAHLCNVAGGNAQSVDGGGRVKFVHMSELIWRKIFICRKSQSGQQHIGHADLQRVTIKCFQIEVIQIFQQAALAAIPQSLQVIRDVVCHGVMAGGTHRICKVSFLGQTAKAGLQRFDNCGCKLRPHRPDGQRAR